MFALGSEDPILKAFVLSGTSDSENRESIAHFTLNTLTGVCSFLNSFTCWIGVLRQFEFTGY